MKKYLGLIVLCFLFACVLTEPKAEPVEKTLAAIEHQMLMIPAGSFRMGGVMAASERPFHDVHVHAFMMSRYEVTQAQWFSLMGSKPSAFEGGRHPVESVSWDEVQLFLKKLNALTAYNYRLPSEAEWEYAARAGHAGGEWSWHLQNLGTAAAYEMADVFAWFRQNSGGKTHAVGLMPPNAYGLQDIHGNVSEWTQDCWHENYKGAPIDGSAWLSGNCSQRVFRGGDWASTVSGLRLAARDARSTRSYGRLNGFRLVRDLVEP